MVVAMTEPRPTRTLQPVEEEAPHTWRRFHGCANDLSTPELPFHSELVAFSGLGSACVLPQRTTFVAVALIISLMHDTSTQRARGSGNRHHHTVLFNFLGRSLIARVLLPSTKDAVL